MTTTLPRCIGVAAESLEAALHYMRRRYDDFKIGEARFLGMIPCCRTQTGGYMGSAAAVGKHRKFLARA
jgi:hypothetical protein